MTFSFNRTAIRLCIATTKPDKFQLHRLLPYYGVGLTFNWISKFLQALRLYFLFNRKSSLTAPPAYIICLKLIIINLVCRFRKMCSGFYGIPLIDQDVRKGRDFVNLDYFYAIIFSLKEHQFKQVSLLLFVSNRLWFKITGR